MENNNINREIRGLTSTEIEQISGAGETCVSYKYEKKCTISNGYETCVKEKIEACVED